MNILQIMRHRYDRPRRASRFATLDPLRPAFRTLAFAAFWGIASLAPAQTASSVPDCEWHIASFSGRVAVERANRTTEAMVEGRNGALWTGEKAATFENGLARLDGAGACQIRMRENARLRRAADNVWDVETGMIGFRFDGTASDTPANLLVTPWARVECRSGIFVVKVAPYLTRVAVVKGEAEVTGQGGGKRTLTAKQECAAVPSALSSVYDVTDDLYFAWYWDKP